MALWFCLTNPPYAQINTFLLLHFFSQIHYFISFHIQCLMYWNLSLHVNVLEFVFATYFIFLCTSPVFLKVNH